MSYANKFTISYKNNEKISILKFFGPKSNKFVFFDQNDSFNE